MILYLSRKVYNCIPSGTVSQRHLKALYVNPTQKSVPTQCRAMQIKVRSVSMETFDDTISCTRRTSDSIQLNVALFLTSKHCDVGTHSIH